MALAGALLPVAGFGLSGGALAAQSLERVAIQTNMGDIVVELDREHAPLSVANFLRYVREGTYDNTSFYRVVPGFVIQGGTFGAAGSSRFPHDPIPLEANNGLKNVRGALSMARTSEPATARTEFFVVLADNPDLDHDPYDAGNRSGYAVFGHVVQGMDVVDKIAAVPLGGEGPYAGSVPSIPVTIRKALAVPAP